MTLIMGLNLSDKLYIASDTRVTRTTVKSSGEVASRILIDNVLKTMPLWDKALGKYEDDGNFITLAVAGDVELNTFLYENIRKDILLKNLSSDIRELSDQIKPYVDKKLEEWVIYMKKEYRNCALLFSGTSNNRGKKVDREKLSQLIKIFNEAHIKSLSMRPKIFEELEKEGSFLYQVNEKLKSQTGKTLIESLNESSVPMIPDRIQNTLNSDGSYINNYPDSLIFGLTIKSGGKTETEKAEWGEMLAYGAVLDAKKQITDEILAQFELSNVKKTNTMPHLMESAMMSGTIKDLAQKNNIDTIGGTITILVMMGDSPQIMGQNLHIDEKNHKIHFKIQDQTFPMFPFNTYYHMTKSTPDKASVFL